MSDISVLEQPSLPVQEAGPGSLPRRIMDTFIAPIALFRFLDFYRLRTSSGHRHEC